MPILSLDSNKRLCIALTSQADGNEVSTNLNAGSVLADQTGFSIPLAIVATSISSTVNFGGLLVGDLVVHIPASAGNTIFYTVVTAGTLPAAAVVNDLYIVLRAYTEPAAASFSF